jgi:hypothetical protein
MAGVMITGCVLACRPAEAIPWVASGTGGDGALDGQADFTISAGKIVVTVTNLLSPTVIRSAGQEVSDVIFTISNAPGTNGTNTAAGQLVNTNGTGVPTNVGGTPGRWVGLEPGKGSFGISGSTITLETIGGGKPTEMILPADNGGGYPNANGNFDNFNPNVDGPATFTLPLSGVTASTTISSVSISFGTGPDTTLTAHPVPAPLIGHGLLALLGIGGVLFGGKLLENAKNTRYDTAWCAEPRF